MKSGKRRDQRRTSRPRTADPPPAADDRNARDHLREPHDAPVQDPMSGYASADALEGGAPFAEDAPAPAPLADPMSGYATPDVLDEKAEVNRAAAPTREATRKDPMSGYASGDLFEERDTDDS